MWSEDFQAHIDQELLSLTSLCATIEQWWGTHSGVRAELEKYQYARIQALRVEAARTLGPGWVPWSHLFYRLPEAPPVPCVCTQGKERKLQRAARGVHSLYECWELEPDFMAELQFEEALPNLQKDFLLAVYTGESVLPAVQAPQATLAQLAKRLIHHLGYSQEVEILAVLGSGTLIGRRLHGARVAPGLGARAGLYTHITRVQGKEIHSSDGRVWERSHTATADGEISTVEGGWAAIEGTCAWLRWRRN